jgi:DUF4097 and DUF4098 domain-containing protein YvlB
MERTFDTPDGLQLDLAIPAGVIRVHAVETTLTTLRIDGIRDADDLRIDLLPRPEGGHHLVVEYRQRKAWGLFPFGQELTCEVAVPLGTDVACSAGSADLAVDGPVGSLGVRVGSGDVRFERVNGDVTVKTGSGDVTGATLGGDLTMHAASGDLLVRRVEGALTARTASGDLRVSAVGGQIVGTTVSGDVEIGSAEGGRAELRSVSGDIEVGVPQGRGVYLDLSSTSGDVRSGLDTEPTPADGPDLELTVSTVSGDVRVRRARGLVAPSG